jgi:hypothetical protein
VSAVVLERVGNAWRASAACQDHDTATHCRYAAGTQLVLFAGGLALLGLGAAVRRWREAPTPEHERSDEPPLGQTLDSRIIPVGSPVSGAAENPGRTDPAEEVAARQ